MNSYDDEYHPLYPERSEKRLRLISLYEPKECMVCAKMCKDYEWKNITTSDSLYLEPGTKMTVTFMRVCKPCSMSNPYMWG